eukprot:CAMPEP_0204381356 /NCGR_PEP_ID=MMETSP0469-20131031/54159_1 /ASSEMBLY_ACC=CAM_ASM_000384 /TAXON_ID=2969 /ORGANISM="Oxyrrhis marina" /LENGTH=44 /DNA_ID= /DNA_START= /DNA_END= /DNA_ORIENTATION=
MGLPIGDAQCVERVSGPLGRWGAQGIQAGLLLLSFVNHRQVPTA